MRVLQDMIEPSAHTQSSQASVVGKRFVWVFAGESIFEATVGWRCEQTSGSSQPGLLHGF
jgi:hypothetical protein